MRLSRRDLLAAGAGIPVALRATPTAADTVRPEQFGARGDGATNDTHAFAAMSAFVNARGGGTIVLRPVTYIVGEQGPGQESGYAFGPKPIMLFIGCSQPLVIRGNGARLRCAPGLRYGTFDPVTGQPTRHPTPYLKGGELSVPYHAMITVRGCTGAVEISDLELDGNLERLRIGGKYGDAGWQLPASGIELVDNSGPERLARIHSHHHPLDGLIINGIDRDRRVRSMIDSVRLDHNGRQGCSIVGGRGYDFRSCRFTDTGKSVIASAPGAGVDIEAEAGKSVRDLTFSSCTFSNNFGCGLVADSGPSDGARFDNCTFIGTTSWAAWPNKPRFRFNGCTFVGSIVHAYGDPDPDRACQFRNCTFRDDPALSPTGEVYGGGNPTRPIADLPGNRNVLFSGCKFLLTHRSALPYTTNVVIFENCTLSQKSPAQGYPRGTFIGRNVITGNVGLYSARIHGELIVNGQLRARTP